MSAAPAHVVETLEFEVAFRHEADAWSQHMRLGDFAAGRMAQVIGEVFDEAATTGDVWRLDRLDVDLGVVPADESEADLEARLRAAIRRALADVAPPQALGGPSRAGPSDADALGIAAAAALAPTRVPSAQADAERLWTLVRLGRLPWQVTRMGPDEFHALVGRVLDADGARFAEALRADPDLPRLVARIAQSWSPEHLQRLLLALAPATRPEAAVAIGPPAAQARAWERALLAAAVPDAPQAPETLAAQAARRAFHDALRDGRIAPVSFSAMAGRDPAFVRAELRALADHPEARARLAETLARPQWRELIGLFAMPADAEFVAELADDLWPWRLGDAAPALVAQWLRQALLAHVLDAPDGVVTAASTVAALVEAAAEIDGRPAAEAAAHVAVAWPTEGPLAAAGLRLRPLLLGAPAASSATTDLPGATETAAPSSDVRPPPEHSAATPTLETATPHAPAYDTLAPRTPVSGSSAPDAAPLASTAPPAGAAPIDQASTPLAPRPADAEASARQPPAAHDPIWDRLAAQLDAGTIEAPGWAILMAGAPDWLRARLLLVGRAAVWRAAFAARLDSGRLVQLLGLWLAPSDAAWLAGAAADAQAATAPDPRARWLLDEALLAGGPTTPQLVEALARRQALAQARAFRDTARDLQTSLADHAPPTDTARQALDRLTELAAGSTQPRDAAGHLQPTDAGARPMARPPSTTRIDPTRLRERLTRRAASQAWRDALADGLSPDRLQALFALWLAPDDARALASLVMEPPARGDPSETSSLAAASATTVRRALVAEVLLAPASARSLADVVHGAARRAGEVSGERPQTVIRGWVAEALRRSPGSEVVARWAALADEADPPVVSPPGVAPEGLKRAPREGRRPSPPLSAASRPEPDASTAPMDRPVHPQGDEAATPGAPSPAPTALPRPASDAARPDAARLADGARPLLHDLPPSGPAAGRPEPSRPDPATVAADAAATTAADRPPLSSAELVRRLTGPSEPERRGALRQLRPRDAEAVLAVIERLEAAWRRLSPEGSEPAPPRPDPDATWRFLAREFVEEDRTFEPLGLAERWFASLTAGESPADVRRWRQAMSAELGAPPLLAPADAADTLSPAVLPPAVAPSWPWLTSPEPATGEALYIPNAGLVLAGPYIPLLLERLELTRDGAFPDEAHAWGAVDVLQLIVDPGEPALEHELVFNKLLCGLDLTAALIRESEVTSEARELVEAMLEMMIQRWSILGTTSVAGLRETFLRRGGALTDETDAWSLVVEPGPFDMLIDEIPWGFRTLKLPWMAQVLHVDWR